MLTRLRTTEGLALTPHFQTTIEYFHTLMPYGVVSCYISRGTPQVRRPKQRLGYLWGFARPKGAHRC